MIAEEQAALRKKDQSSVLGEAVAQNLKVKKEGFSSNQNFFIVEKYIVAHSIVVVKYLEFIQGHKTAIFGKISVRKTI